MRYDLALTKSKQSLCPLPAKEMQVKCETGTEISQVCLLCDEKNLSYHIVT